MSTNKQLIMISLTLFLASCGDMADDLRPSGDDLRSAITANSTGAQVGQKSIDISASNADGSTFVLSDYLAGGAKASDAVVLYFTMWCPICLSHTDHMLYNIVPQFQSRGKTTYVLVDYVSGSVAATKVSESVNGYAGSVFTSIADENQVILSQLQGAMGKVIVIDGNGIIQMSEDYKTGDNLSATLDKILP